MSGSPIPSSSFTASVACTSPITPGSTPRTPASLQLGTRPGGGGEGYRQRGGCPDRKSTRLNSSHTVISYAVFCLKKKKKNSNNNTSESSVTLRYPGTHHHPTRITPQTRGDLWPARRNQRAIVAPLQHRPRTQVGM